MFPQADDFADTKRTTIIRAIRCHSSNSQIIRGLPWSFSTLSHKSLVVNSTNVSFPELELDTTLSGIWFRQYFDCFPTQYHVLHDFVQVLFCVVESDLVEARASKHSISVSSTFIVDSSHFFVSAACAYCICLLHCVRKLLM